ncbi:hypothetical protein IFM46972_00997 [Aspergillus udagawae]|uniref:Uncharacterized protein n=1 Tax=Aspergillus udagawae TaxID=91492 RepID=A0A8H3N466_9EURO|nr:hypothetical protein IFM46972_00997 [Aspergillus udagawae]
MAEQLLLWLNGRVDFRQAYTLDWSGIIALLADIASQPSVYGVPPQNVANLLLVHADISRLRRPDGADYLVPPPPQNIDRKRHPNWPSALSQFQLTKSTFDGVEYWALPDLLGLFMSTLGRAPATATKRNFYLPLTAVFGQWCSKLIREGRPSCPSVFQCSWTEDGEFHLGASRGGFATDSRMGSRFANDLGHVVKMSRLCLLTWPGVLRVTGRKYRNPDLPPSSGKQTALQNSSLDTAIDMGEILPFDDRLTRLKSRGPTLGRLLHPVRSAAMTDSSIPFGDPDLFTPIDKSSTTKGEANVNDPI